LPSRDVDSISHHILSASLHYLVWWHILRPTVYPYFVWMCTGRFRVGLNFRKGRRGSPSTDQDRMNNSSPSKSNIRVLEIMAGGGANAALKEQPAAAAPPTVTEAPRPDQSIKPSSPPTMTSVTLDSEGPMPVVDVHVSPAAPLTVPAFSSQYMVAVAIDFGLTAAALS